MSEHTMVSVVVPCYNEAGSIAHTHEKLITVLQSLPDAAYEIIYVNDGSRDATQTIIASLAQHEPTVRVLSLSRNFGKEIATTAGIAQSKGNAVVVLDADGQHPVDIIPQFIDAWRGGAEVVVGVRVTNQREGLIKRYGSKLFYAILNRLNRGTVVPGSTDFRLMDASVRDAFLSMTERRRFTRGMIDWLGFRTTYISFHANARTSGDAAYSFGKLFQLALDGFVSMSHTPLYLIIYCGLAILPVSALMAIVAIVEMTIGDPLSWNVTGTAYIALLILFFVGVLLVAQGITALYVSHIHSETQNRPLFVIDRKSSIRIDPS